MKKLIFTLSICIAAFAAQAQVSSETRPVGDFTGIKTASIVEVEITQGEANAVVIETEAAGQKDVSTVVKDGILTIRIENQGNVGDGVKAKITVKNLSSIDADGTCSIKSMNQLIADSIRIEGSSAAVIDLDLKARSVYTRLSGAANTKIKGTSENLEADLSGAAQLKAYKLIANNVKLDATGAASAHVHANNRLNAKTSGAAEVSYEGNPTDKVMDATGASSVAMRNTDNNDTTNVRIGGYDVSVVGNDDDDDERSKREKKADDDDFEFWSGMDLGVCGLLTYNNKIDMPNGFEFLRLNYAKSYAFTINAYQKNIHIYRNNVNLGTGIGLSWYHYNFKESYSLQPDAAFATAVFDSLNYSKNRLNMCYVNVPLFLEFNTNNNDASHSFHIGGGMEFGYNVFQNKLKQKYEIDGRDYKRKIKNDFNVNPFRMDAIARIGYGDFSIFGAYSLTTLFEKNKGPVVYPFTAGIHLDF